MPSVCRLEPQHRVNLDRISTDAAEWRTGVTSLSLGRIVSTAKLTRKWWGHTRYRPALLLVTVPEPAALAVTVQLRTVPLLLLVAVWAACDRP